MDSPNIINSTLYKSLAQYKRKFITIERFLKQKILKGTQIGIFAQKVTQTSLVRVPKMLILFRFEI